MRTWMFVLIAALVLPAAIEVVAPQKARAQAPAEAGDKQGAPGKQELPSHSPQKIVVTSPLITDVVVTQKYSGLVRALRHIEVRAPAAGYLETMAARESQAVKQGDVLFKLAPNLDKTQLAKLEVEMADVQVAQLEFANTKELFEKKVVSEVELKLSEAKLARAKAKAKVAQAELEFVTIKAPFDGLLGRLAKQVGSLVDQGDSLTTLSDNSVMRVYFGVPEKEYLEFMTGHHLKDSQIELMLADERKFSQPGKISAIEADFNNETGNIPFRADFPNPDRLLRHGQTATVLMHRTVKNALVIPQRATFEFADRRYVYVVGNDGVARQRKVAVQHEVDDIFVINKGLDVSDRIVLDGYHRLRDIEKAEYEFRKPEEAVAGPKVGR